VVAMTQLGDGNKMSANHNQSWEIFVADFDAALQSAVEHSNLSQILELTVLEDLMRSQCIIADENVNLLNFELPMRLLGALNNVGERLGAEFESWQGEQDDLLHVHFLSEEDQDVFMQLFEEMSMLGRRSYLAPDLYLGNHSADLHRCKKVLNFLSQEVNRIPNSN
jgi:hypothetical protein